MVNNKGILKIQLLILLNSLIFPFINNPIVLLTVTCIFSLLILIWLINWIKNKKVTLKHANKIKSLIIKITLLIITLGLSTFSILFYIESFSMFIFAIIMIPIMLITILIIIVYYRELKKKSKNDQVNQTSL